MSPLDLLVFIGFIAGVLIIGLVMSSGKFGPKDEDTDEASGYFLAGRGLKWWLIGFSLIAANISTEQFVGMSGKAADWLGMAIASYEWMAAITLVVTAFLFLPTFLRCGIYTIPEFLQYRYGTFSRMVLAVATLVILVGVPTASVIFSGAKVISVAFQENTLLGLNLGDITTACWIIGILAAAYVFAGGLKACAWADLIQGSALIIGGVIMAYLAFSYLGESNPDDLIHTAANGTVSVEQLEGASGWERFVLLNQGPADEGGKLHMVRPSSDPEIPWTALIIGLWIPNFFYWGLNQYIVQRTLGSKSLAEGQKGIIFAAFMKLLVPFVVVIPGILAFNLFSAELGQEAGRKNASILEHLGTDSVVIPMTMDFADQNPKLALEIIQNNSAATGMALETVPVSASDLITLNTGMIRNAEASGIEVTTRVIGYDYDAAFPTLLRKLLKTGSGLKGFVFAAIFGAVVSSLASMLNSASTIFAMDIFSKLHPSSSHKGLVMVGRICVIAFTVIACLIAPKLGSPEFGGIFTFIQEFQGFISPGVLAIFLFGLLVPKAPRFLGWLGILLNAGVYGLLKFSVPSLAFLDRMAISFGIVLLVLLVMTLVKPLQVPVVLPRNDKMEIKHSKGAMIGGGIVVAMTLCLYAIFW